MKKQHQAGQSMVEVLVALAAAVIIISSIAVAVITSSSNTTYSTRQNKATQLAQEGLNAARQLRDASYADFFNKSGSYCLGNGQTAFPGDLGDDSDCDNRPNLDNTYIRKVTFLKPGVEDNHCNGVTEVRSEVFWTDSKCTDSNDPYCHSASLVSCFSDINAIPTP